MIEVCTVFAPRPSHPKWRDDYVDMLRAQKHSAERVGHTHLVITDGEPIAGLNCAQVDDLGELMPAMIKGIIERLKRKVDTHILFVDADCLIDRNCALAFKHQFDLGLTYRDDPVSPINNGAMYMKQAGAGRARMFFLKALERCELHWGGDQEAISQTAAPVAHEIAISERAGATIFFMPPKSYAAVPRVHLARHDSFVVHFKGEKKDWMLDYAREYHDYKVAA